MKLWTNLSIVAGALASLIIIFMFMSGEPSFPDFYHGQHATHLATVTSPNTTSPPNPSIQTSVAPPRDTQPESASIADGSHWNHNGSLMYLRVDGTSRRIYYLVPRQGMLDAGAKPDSLLFDGSEHDGRWSGSAYIFNKRCGRRYAYLVEGAPKANEAIIELVGSAPHVGLDCAIDRYGGSNDDLIFSLAQ